jgi:hypothetical protein
LGKVNSAAATIVVNPAAGPLTLSGDFEMNPVISPPTIPAMIPENNGAFEPSAIPKHSGRATKKTTIEAGKSDLK